MHRSFIWNHCPKLTKLLLIYKQRSELHTLITGTLHNLCSNWHISAVKTPISMCTPRLYSQWKKNCVLFYNNSLGGNVWCYLAPDVILPIDHISLTLDGVMSFLRLINVRNLCKRLHYGQTCGGISSVHWRKVREIWRIQMLFVVSCVEIEIDQLVKCVNCWVIIHCLSVSCKQINLIFFTTDHQTVNYYSTMHSLTYAWTYTIWATASQNQQNDCASSEDSNQPGHLPSLSVWRNIGSLASYWAHSEDSDQIRQICRLF